MKSPNLIMTDQFTAIKGNPELKNFHFISPTLSYNIVPNKLTSFNVFARWQYLENPSTYIWEPMEYDGRTIVVRSYTNAGYLSNLHYGISGTLKLFDNNLYLKTTLSQHYFKQSGPSEISTWPLSVRCQVNWYIKNLAVSASWEKSTKYVSIFQTKKWPQNYFVALTYGNGNFVASFTCKNLFNGSWRTTKNLYHSNQVDYDIQHFGNDNHRSFVLNLSYSFSYGKKTNRKDRIEKSGMPNSAIVE